LEENHYYPFGLKHQNYNTGRRQLGKKEEILAGNLTLMPALVLPTEDKPMVYKYKYNGKEWQDELGLNVYDYGYRGYDPAIGRWSAVDPLAEKYITTSPYAFVQNNPLINREIDGRYFEEGSKSERQAARIERRAEKRADKLNKKADRLDAKGKSTGDLRDRASELRQTGQDVRDMRNDQSTEYKYAKVNSKMSGPATVGTGTNSKGDQVVTMFTEKNMGNQIHETRHGGQHFRGEVNAVTQESSIAVEVSAYRAQYSWNGSLKANTLDSSTISNIVDFQTNIHNQILMSANQMPFGVQQTNISNISQINSGFVSNIVEIGQGGGRAPLPIVQNYLLWIYAGLK
jgi:RHS repeat-associated protein